MLQQSFLAKLLTAIAAVLALVFLSFAGAFCQDMRGGGSPLAQPAGGWNIYKSRFL